MASVTALGEAEATSPPEPVPTNAEIIPPAEMVDFVIDLASPGKNRPQVSSKSNIFRINAGLFLAIFPLTKLHKLFRNNPVNLKNELRKTIENFDDTSQPICGFSSDKNPYWELG